MLATSNQRRNKTTLQDLETFYRISILPEINKSIDCICNSPIYSKLVPSKNPYICIINKPQHNIPSEGNNIKKLKEPHHQVEHI